MRIKSGHIIQSHKTSPGLFCAWGEQPIVAALLAIIFYCVYFFVICKLPVIGVPTFRIDYLVTTVTNASAKPSEILISARPVAGMFHYAQAVLAKYLFNGQGKYIIYPLQHIVLLIYFISISKVIESIFKFKFDVFAFLSAWILFVANPGAVEGVYKLESIVGTLSMLFGGLALIFLVRWDRDKKRSSAALFILLYALSIFSKEDFILPPLMLLGWYLVRNNDWKQQAVRHKWLLLAVFSVLFFFLIFNKFIIPHRSYMDPVQKTGHPYFMTLNPRSVANVIYYYLTGLGRNIKLLTAFYLLTTLTFFVVMKDHRKEVILIGLIVLGMIAPYSIMPNHVYSYYGLKWWAWQTLTSLALVQIIFISKSKIVTGMFTALILLFVFTTLDKNISNYFRNCITTSENIQNFLSMNREAINAQERVAVIGIGPGQITNSPWQGNGETEIYLRGDLKLDTQWILFVESGDDRYVIDSLKGSDFNPSERVIVLDRRELSGFSNIPKLIFSPDGYGRFM
jgi:hypothetical protein